MARLPRNDRNNLLRYAEFVVEKAPTAAQRNTFRRQLTNYTQMGGNTTYNKKNLSMLSRGQGSFAVEIKKARYDDLFEDFNEAGYIDLDSIDTKQDLRKQLDEALGKNPVFASFRDKTPRKFRSMVSQFFEGMADSQTARSNITRRRRAAIITTDREEELRQQVNLSQRENLRRRIRMNNAFLIFNQKLDREQIVYRDTRGRFHDINTGRFAPKPTQITLR